MFLVIKNASQISDRTHVEICQETTIPRSADPVLLQYESICFLENTPAVEGGVEIVAAGSTAIIRLEVTDRSACSS